MFVIKTGRIAICNMLNAYQVHTFWWLYSPTPAPPCTHLYSFGQSQSAFEYGVVRKLFQK